MKKFQKKKWIGLAVTCSLLPLPFASADPQWWSAPATSIREPGVVPRDYSPVNVGQLKNVASQAKRYLDAILSSAGGSGREITAACQFANSGNYSPVNIGQLKNVAKPFYDRMAQIHYNWRTGGVGVASPLYPWTGTSGAENAMPANLGQLKNVFSFEFNSMFLSLDEDGDGIPSWWELTNGLNPASNSDSDRDDDFDGLPTFAEYLNGSDPGKVDSDGDWASDAEENSAGTSSSSEASAPLTFCMITNYVKWDFGNLPHPSGVPVVTPRWFDRNYTSFDAQGGHSRPGGAGGPLTTLRSFDQQARDMTYPDISPFTIPFPAWPSSGTLGSSVYIRSDGIGSAFTAGASVWLRGPKSDTPVTRTCLVISKQISVAGTVTTTITAEPFTLEKGQNLSEVKHLVAPLSKNFPYAPYTSESSMLALLPIDIEEVISDQIAGNEANKLPSPYFGGNPAKPENGYPNNPMLMATRTGSDARLMIKMNVPAAQAASVRVGVREAGQTIILNSVASVPPPGKTPLSFTAFAGTKLYEVVAGYDANGNSVLENAEVAVVFEKTPRKDKEGNAATANLHLIDKFRVVTQADFNAARATTDNHADGILVDWLDSAEGLLKAFARGATSVPEVPEATTTWGHVLLGSPSPSPQGLSHPVGATWTTPANNSTTLRFEWPTGSDLSEDVVGSAGLTAMIKRLLFKHRATLAAAATAMESVVTLNTITDDGINFRDTDKNDQVHVALGACKFEGGMQVKVKKGTGTALEVSEIDCWGALFDLYDWGYDAPQIKLPITGQVIGEPREAAKVQAGFATLAASTSWPSAGRVFFTKVNFGTGWRDLDVTIP